jgi:hypothetical protein
VAGGWNALLGAIRERSWPRIELALPALDQQAAEHLAVEADQPAHGGEEPVDAEDQHDPDHRDGAGRRQRRGEDHEAGTCDARAALRRDQEHGEQPDLLPDREVDPERLRDVERGEAEVEADAKPRHDGLVLGGAERDQQLVLEAPDLDGAGAAGRAGAGARSSTASARRVCAPTPRSTSRPTRRISVPTLRTEIVPRLRETAEAISRDIGYVSP